MRGAAMSLTAAASGFVVFLLSVSVIQGQNDWGVTYTSTEICAFKGSTVNISCNYTYPTTKYGPVQKTLWFTNSSNNDFVDLKTDSKYSGRVQYICHNNKCTLRITDLRESDSAEYRFRFTTENDGKYFGTPGVHLSVTGLQVQVNKLKVYESNIQAELKCQSSSYLPGHRLYVWYKNEENIQGQTNNSYSGHIDPADRYSCAVQGYEKSRSAPVYVPRVEPVSVSPSGEIVENSSVTLTCSSDANPAAHYAWYKKNGGPDLHPLSNEAELVFRSIQSSDSGEYYCTTGNLTFSISKYISISVKSPKGAGGEAAAAGAITVVLLAILALSVFLWIRKKRAPKAEERPGNREQGQLEEQGDLQYADIQFSNNQADSLYSNTGAAQPLRHMEQQAVVEYDAVKFNSA